MSRIIREAKQTDMPDIMKVMEAAKKIMRSSGNMHQWGEGYPSEVVITADMEKSGGFVIEDEGHVVGYFAFLPSPEPTYHKIYDGKWLDDELSYHVVHRIASYPDAHHMQTSVLIRIVTTPSCSTICRSMASPIAASSIWHHATSDWLIKE